MDLDFTGSPINLEAPFAAPVSPASGDLDEQSVETSSLYRRQALGLECPVVEPLESSLSSDRQECPVIEEEIRMIKMSMEYLKSMSDLVEENSPDPRLPEDPHSAAEVPLRLDPQPADVPGRLTKDPPPAAEVPVRVPQDPQPIDVPGRLTKDPPHAAEVPGRLPDPQPVPGRSQDPHESPEQAEKKRRRQFDINGGPIATNLRQEILQGLFPKMNGSICPKAADINHLARRILLDFEDEAGAPLLRAADLMRIAEVATGGKEHFQNPILKYALKDEPVKVMPHFCLICRRWTPDVQVHVCSS